MDTTHTHPCHHARLAPERVALTMAQDGHSLTYAELEAASNRGAHALRACGMRPADHVAVLLGNHPGFLPFYWAAMRAGLYFTPISSHSTAEEAAYIVRDCGARLVVSSGALREVAAALPALAPQVRHWFSLDDAFGCFAGWDRASADRPATPIGDEVGGHNMMYSSGTTGRPKGIKVAFANQPIEALVPVMRHFAAALGYDKDTVYLSPAPLYHAAPLGFCATVMRLGGRVVVLDKFDPEAFLQCIERYRVTHTQLVPTMFVRLLKLPPEVRARYDLSSLRCALHAAAPCPVAVKQQMMDWWGPVIYEQYSGSEGNGCTFIGPRDWLAHKGSVGRALVGQVRIVGEDGGVLPAGEVGAVYFESERRFAYHNDPDKTREAFHPNGWSTLGDVGYLDEEGYLYLTDRKAYMIISGGVNIYPQEAENVLTVHPKVADVAVFGVPNEEFGEEVKAVVQPVDMAAAGPALAEELIAWCRQHLAGFKCPRSIDFEPALPRHENGKLYKRKLRDRYWAGRENRLV